MQAEKVIINTDSKNGKLLMGSDFHVLKDETEIGLNTSDMDSFLSYLEDFKDYSVTYDEDHASAVPKKYGYHDNIIARCGMQISNALDKIKTMLNYQLSLERFEYFLLYMKPFLDEGGLNLLALSRDFKVSKLTKIVRKKERNGNYHFMISKESADNEDFEPPETISFHIPIFKHVDTSHKFTFDFEFDYKLDDGEPNVFFKFFNAQFETQLKEFQKELMVDLLSSLKCKKFWGDIMIHKQTDSWKYQENRIHI